MTREEKIEAVKSRHPKCFGHAEDEIKTLTVDGNELFWTLKHPDKVTPEAFEELKIAFMPLKHQSEK